MNDYFLIAKIDSVYGKKGFVKIFSFSDYPNRFLILNKVFIDFFDDKKVFFVEKAIKNNNNILLKFKNFNTPDDVKILIGRNIFVDEENLVKLPENHIFIHDLIGSKVYRNNSEFGIITDVLTYPANDVYVIQSKGKEILIPAALDFFESYDSKNKILILKAGDSLYDED